MKRTAESCPAAPALRSASCRPTDGWSRWPKGTSFTYLTRPRAKRRFRSIPPTINSATPITPEEESARDQEIGRLKHELGATKAYLQSVIEQKEFASLQCTAVT